MAEERAYREALTSRIIPQMILSDASNPLTAPTPRKLEDPVLTARDRAIQRFTVSGNAIVTGGAGALGLEASRSLLEHGSPGLCLFDIPASFQTSQPAIETLRADFPQSKVLIKAVNVADHQAVEAAVDESAAELGSIDILLCFAGVVDSTHAADMSPEQWRRVLDINTTGSWFPAQAVGKQMIKQGTGGSIMFTASTSAHRVNYPQPQVGYNASKAAILQLKSSLAAEWARYGIRVNSISPGYMDTVLNEGPGLDVVKKIWLAKNPMGRMGDPSEIAGVVILLCSPAGKYINGADLAVDGGASLLF